MHRALVLLAALGAAGCSRKSVEEFCRAQFEALSARDVRCGGAADVAQANWTPFEGYFCDGIAHLEREGKVQYDPGAGDACLARLEALACGPQAPLEDDPCDRAVLGQVQAGGECFNGLECARGSICAASACPGRCTLLAPVGFECGGLTRCQEGAHCLSGTCVASSAEGQACRVGSLDCAEGLYCAGEKPIQASPPGACRPVGAQATGAACDQQLACAGTSVCAGLDTVQNVPGTCRAPLADGSPCTASSACAPESFCRDGACAPRPRVGEPCGMVGGGTAACLTGWCRIADGAGTCAGFLSPGEACDAVDACGRTARCEGGRCVALCRPP